MFSRKRKVRLIGSERLFGFAVPSAYNFLLCNFNLYKLKPSNIYRRLTLLQSVTVDSTGIVTALLYSLSSCHCHAAICYVCCRTIRSGGYPVPFDLALF